MKYIKLNQLITFIINIVRNSYVQYLPMGCIYNDRYLITFL